MRTRTYSADVKRETVEELLAGEKRVSQICRERGSDEKTLQRWRQAYEEDGEAAWVTRESRLRRLGRLQSRGRRRFLVDLRGQGQPQARPDQVGIGQNASVGKTRFAPIPVEDLRPAVLVAQEPRRDSP